MDKMNHKQVQATEVYQAPECLVLALGGGLEICQTSLGAGEIQPGTGDNWGTL